MIDSTAFSYLLFVLTLWRGSLYYDCGSRKLNNTLQALLSTLVEVNPKAWKKKLHVTDWKPTGTSNNFCSLFPWLTRRMTWHFGNNSWMWIVSNSGYRVDPQLKYLLQLQSGLGRLLESSLRFAGCHVSVSLSSNSSFFEKFFLNIFPYSYPYLLNIFRFRWPTYIQLDREVGCQNVGCPFVFGKYRLDSQLARCSCETCPGSFSLPSSKTSDLRWSSQPWLGMVILPTWAERNGIRFLHPGYQGQNGPAHYSPW